MSLELSLQDIGQEEGQHEWSEERITIGLCVFCESSVGIRGVGLQCLKILLSRWKIFY